MSKAGSLTSTMRAEARLLSLAGFQVLAIGFPFTLFQVALSLSGEVPPLLPIAVGAPALFAGYLPCHLAAARLAVANRLDGLA